MLFSRALAAFASFPSVRRAKGPPELGEVLGKHVNLTKYHDLITVSLDNIGKTGDKLT